MFIPVKKETLSYGDEMREPHMMNDMCSLENTCVHVEFLTNNVVSFLEFDLDNHIENCNLISIVIAPFSPVNLSVA